MPNLGPRHATFRIGPAAGKHDHARHLMLVCLVQFYGWLCAPFSSKRLVQDNANQPSRNRGFVAKIRDMGVGARPSLLNNILGLAIIACHGPRGTIEFAVVAPHEFGKSSSIACRHAHDDVEIGQLPSSLRPRFLSDFFSLQPNWHPFRLLSDAAETERFPQFIGNLWIVPASIEAPSPA